MRFCLRYFVLLFFCFRLGISSAQIGTWSFTNFGDGEGMPEKFIYSAVQDTNGKMWFGTASGLYGFDGVRFKLFVNNSESVNGDQASIALFAEGDKIWIAGQHSLSFFSLTDFSFSSPTFTDSSFRNAVESGILNFFRDSKGNMWLATATNFWCRYEERDNSAFFYSPVDTGGHTSRFINKIFEDYDGNLWAVGRKQLFRFSAASNRVETFSPKKMVGSFTAAVYLQKENCIWLVQNGAGITCFDVNAKKFSDYEVWNEVSGKRVRYPYISTLAQKSDNELWISPEAIGIFNTQTHQCTIRDAGFESDYSFRTYKIANFFTDREKNLWLCSFTGLSQLPYTNALCKTFALIDDNSKNSLHPGRTVQIPNTKNLLLAGSSGTGLQICNYENSYSRTVSHPLYKKNSSGNFAFYDVCLTQQQEIFAAANDGLYQFLSANNSLKKLKDERNSAEQKIPLTGVLSDASGNLVLEANGKGCFVFSKSNNSWNKFFHEQNRKDLALALIDHSGNTWFTANDGLHRLNLQTGLWQHIQNADSVSLKSVVSMIEIADNHFWITSRTSGLYELKLDNGIAQLKNYNTENLRGLPGNNCVSIARDKNNFLWIGTISGLVKFDAARKEVLSVFTQQNGLVNNDASGNIFITAQNELVLSYFGKLNILPLNGFPVQRKDNRIFLSSFKLLGKEFELPLRQPELTHLQFSFNQNFLQFEFAAVHYNNSQQTEYAYQLKGADDDWVYAGNRSYVSYRGLPAGNFVFNVKARPHAGEWSETQTLLQFKINPPFYQTWWFLLSVVVVFLLAVFSFYRFRISQIKQAEKMKTEFRQQISDMEMQALRAQMNPHFIFNALNSINRYILKNDHEAASDYLTKFSRLIRLILDQSQQKTTSLENELQMLKLYMEMENMRFDNRFSFHIYCDETLNTEAIQIPSMLIQPYVENSIWHGLMHKTEAGNLWLRFEKNSGEELKIEIEDDGIGRDKAAELKSKQTLKRKSYGMQITSDRISLTNRMNGVQIGVKVFDLKQENGEASGTRVQLLIKFSEMNYLKSIQHA